jgi:hypothetical protein
MLIPPSPPSRVDLKLRLVVPAPANAGDAAASARADERGVGLGHLHGLRYFSNLYRSELRLDLVNVELFIQPRRQA